MPLSLLLLGLLSVSAAEPPPTASEGHGDSGAQSVGEPDDPAAPAPTPDEPASPTRTEPSVEAPAPVPPAVDDAPESLSTLFADVLARAKRSYFSGEHEIALAQLQALEIRLMQGEQPNWEHAAEAMVFNGEILFASGRSEEAGAAFRWVLEEDPDYPISPYHHPIEVVGHFELIRRAVQEERERATNTDPPEIATPERHPPPAQSYLPLGLPQFTQGRPAAGVAFALLQTGLGIASVATYAQLNAANADPALHPLGWTQQQVDTRVRTRRYVLQWPLTLGFYGSWLWSHADARRSWRSREVAPIDVTWSPGGTEAPGCCGTVTVRGSF
ncbi:MAG: hypothetical protein ACI8PZ_003983 [Myxococcota bacterium]|jgi:hypothetical protein